MIDENYHDCDEAYPLSSSMISTCCGAKPLGELDESPFGSVTGICRDCRDHATFEKEDDDH